MANGFQPLHRVADRQRLHVEHLAADDVARQVRLALRLDGDGLLGQQVADGGGRLGVVVPCRAAALLQLLHPPQLARHHVGHAVDGGVQRGVGALAAHDAAARRQRHLRLLHRLARLLLAAARRQAHHGLRGGGASARPPPRHAAESDSANCRRAFGRPRARAGAAAAAAAAGAGAPPWHPRRTATARGRSCSARAPSAPA